MVNKTGSAMKDDKLVMRPDNGKLVTLIDKPGGLRGWHVENKVFRETALLEKVYSQYPVLGEWSRSSG